MREHRRVVYQLCPKIYPNETSQLHRERLVDVNELLCDENCFRAFSLASVDKGRVRELLYLLTDLTDEQNIVEVWISFLKNLKNRLELSTEAFEYLQQFQTYHDEYYMPEPHNFSDGTHK